MQAHSFRLLILGLPEGISSGEANGHSASFFSLLNASPLSMLLAAMALQIAQAGAAAG